MTFIPTHPISKKIRYCSDIENLKAYAKLYDITITIRNHVKMCVADWYNNNVLSNCIVLKSYDSRANASCDTDDRHFPTKSMKRRESGDLNVRIQTADCRL